MFALFAAGAGVRACAVRDTYGVVKSLTATGALRIVGGAAFLEDGGTVWANEDRDLDVVGAICCVKSRLGSVCSSRISRWRI
jgi:hypothetical protein